jgi:hypothetical protein
MGSATATHRPDFIGKTEWRRMMKRQRGLEIEATKLLSQWKRRMRQRYPSEARLEEAARGKPLPAEQCGCRECRENGHAGWPVGYQRGATGKSYECWLHAQSEWFLHALPSSSSIVRFG